MAKFHILPHIWQMFLPKTLSHSETIIFMAATECRSTSVTYTDKLKIRKRQEQVMERRLYL